MVGLPLEAESLDERPAPATPHRVGVVAGQDLGERLGMGGGVVIFEGGAAAARRDPVLLDAYLGEDVDV